MARYDFKHTAAYHRRRAAGYRWLARLALLLCLLSAALGLLAAGREEVGRAAFQGACAFVQLLSYSLFAGRAAWHHYQAWLYD